MLAPENLAPDFTRSHPDGKAEKILEYLEKGAKQS